MSRRRKPAHVAPTDDRHGVRRNDGASVAERGPAANSTSLVPPLGDGEYAGGQLANVLGLHAEQQKVGTSAAVNVPTILMENMLARQRERNLPLQVADEVVRALKPGPVHMISRVTQILRPERDEQGLALGEYMRCLVWLCLNDDDDATRPWVEWTDFDAEIIGRLAEAVANQHEGRGTIGDRRTGRPISELAAPRWAGAVSYAPVYERARFLATAMPVESGGETAPRQVLAASEFSLLRDAHVLRIDPEQIAVLPEWESAEQAFDYAAECTLPFDPVYLDFEGPGCVPPFACRWGENDNVTISGALVSKATGTLLIAPVGWPSNTAQRIDSSGAYGWSRYETPGWFRFGVEAKNERGEHLTVGDVRAELGGLDIGGPIACVSAEVCMGVDDAVEMPGYAMLPFTRETIRAFARERAKAEGEDAAVIEVTDYLTAWGALIYQLALRVLAALSITEAVEVEIVDAPMEKRDRKRAEKRGWPIAQQVVIRSSRRYRDEPDRKRRGEEEESWYSHRFWVRAHVAHYPLGTRLADVRPDLVTPCNRPPESNCGFCRKVKRVAHIKGPEEAPLVLKTLVRHKGHA